jgi:hypothetical protein
VYSLEDEGRPVTRSPVPLRPRASETPELSAVAGRRRHADTAPRHVLQSPIAGRPGVEGGVPVALSPSQYTPPAMRYDVYTGDCAR